MGPSDLLHLPALPAGRPGWTPEARAVIERIFDIDEAIRQEALPRLPPTTREVLIGSSPATRTGTPGSTRKKPLCWGKSGE